MLPGSSSKLAALAAAAAALLLILAFSRPAKQDAVRRIDPARTADPATAPRRARDASIIRFGFEYQEYLDEETRIFSSFLRYLEKRTGLSFELRFVKKSETVGENLGSGIVDFSVIGAANYVLGRRNHGFILLARELNAERKGESRSTIVVRPDSDITRVADVRGRTFNFVREGSTRGHILPTIMLANAGIRLGDLKNYHFADSYNKGVEELLAGRYDAAGIQLPLALKLAGEKAVRIVEVSESFPSSVVAANRNVDPRTVEQVRRALLEMDPAGRDKDLLFHWEKSDMPGGYGEADASQYDIYEAAFVKLGLLAPRGGASR